MNTEIKTVHLEINEKIKEFINKKMHKIDFAKDLLIDLLFTLTKEKKEYKAEVTINFRWGYSTHLHVHNFDLFEAINKLFDKMELKITKEKVKVQEHN